MISVIGMAGSPESGIAACSWWSPMVVACNFLVNVLIEELLQQLREGPRRYHQGMSWPDRIVIDPEVLAGKPVIRGTRLAVEFILDLLAAGQSEADILANYPGLKHDDILACLAYASHLAHEYKAYLLPV